MKRDTVPTIEGSKYMERINIGVVFGRFQPLHNGHVEYISAAFEICDRVVFGITNPFSKCNDTIQRLSSKNNPFSYYQRLTMLNTYLKNIGIERERYEIVPFPIENPEEIKYTIPPDAVLLLSICGWRNKGKKLSLIKKLGYRNITLFNKPLCEKIISGSKIRQSLMDIANLHKYVPPPVVELIHGWDCLSLNSQARVEENKV
jgi:cytidyltransferase-like protein